MFEKIDNYNATILNLAMEKYVSILILTILNLLWNMSMALLNFPSILPSNGNRRFNYANGLTNIRPNPISLAKYDIEDFLDFVDEA